MSHLQRTEIVMFNYEKNFLQNFYSFINVHICRLNENVRKLRTLILKYLFIELIYIFEKKNLHLWIGPDVNYLSILRFLMLENTIMHEMH